jgi:hypothetical protein
MDETLERTDRQLAALTALASTPVAWACLVLGGMATGFDEQAFTDPARALELSSARVVAASWFCDVLGFYTLIVPSTLYVRRWLTGRSALGADVITALLLGYSLVGALGAAIHAGADPHLVLRYQGAMETERQGLVNARMLIEALVNNGIWQYGSMLLGGLGWTGTGALLLPGRRLLGGLALLLGLVSLLVPLGGLLDLRPVWETALVTYFLLAPLYASVLGVSLLRA